ncbi:hypothetical protein SAY86_008532 [Trapa natans]|uniref:Uncharacterized protein n=1 Tax=Trapa natans TaxID=22666 RepID=A0AAN7KD15_TRANT|nr:hypothetical protein SAY86_008532 [Trapa natans]
MAIEDDNCNFNFNLVKSILKLGGSFESEVLEPWDSINLPLDSKVLDHQLHPVSELHGPDCSDSNCIHQLLFGLTNEASSTSVRRTSLTSARPPSSASSP